MVRGEIWWASLPEPIGCASFVIIQLINPTGAFLKKGSISKINFSLKSGRSKINFSLKSGRSKINLERKARKL